jgi:hypothetical protein
MGWLHDHVTVTALLLAVSALTLLPPHYLRQVCLVLCDSSCNCWKSTQSILSHHSQEPAVSTPDRPAAHPDLAEESTARLVLLIHQVQPQAMSAIQAKAGAAF